MATIKSTVYVCDMCGSTGDVSPYIIGKGRARPKSYDLCATCACPVDEIVGTNRGQAPISSPRTPVRSIAELERLKKEEAAETKKRATPRKRRVAPSGDQA